MVVLRSRRSDPALPLSEVGYSVEDQTAPPLLVMAQRLTSELLAELLTTWRAEALLHDSDELPHLLTARQGLLDLGRGKRDLTLLGVRLRRGWGRTIGCHVYRSVPEIPVPYPSASSAAPKTNRRRVNVR